MTKLPVAGAVLASAARVKNQSWRRPMVLGGTEQSFADQLCFHSCGRRVTRDLTAEAEYVFQGGQIQAAFARWDIRDIVRQEWVRLRGLEDLAQYIFCNRQGMC